MPGAYHRANLPAPSVPPAEAYPPVPTPAPRRRGKRRAQPKPRLYHPAGKDEDLYAPRPLRSDAGPLAVQLLALEVPECACKPVWVETPCRCEDDCDCPRGYSPPCRHVLEAAFNAVRLSLGGWAALVRAYDPEGYDGPGDPPPVACVALARAEYLLALEERALARYGLWHPGDRRRKGRGAGGVRGSPGRREGDGELVLDVPPPPKPPPDEGVLDAVARCARGRVPPPGWVLREKQKKGAMA